MKKNRKKILLIIIAFLPLFIFHILPEKKNDRGITKGYSQKNSPGKIILFKDFIHSYKEIPKETGQKKFSQNPLPGELKNIKITELKIEKDQPQLTEKEAKKKEIFNKMTSSMDRSLALLSSFKLKGEMMIKIPAMDPDEDEFNKGNRYGKKIEVKSSFTLKKDDRGNIYLSQRTSTDRGNTRFDRKDYNKDIYLMGENYFEYDQLGNEKKGGVTKSRIEPLAQTNWIRVLKDLYPVMDFYETQGDFTTDSYELIQNSPGKGDRSIKPDDLSGNVEFQNTTGVMTKGNIKGSGKLEYGYISGAHVEFSIKMDMDEINSASRIILP